MQREALFARYQELQRYVGWVPTDAQRIRAVAPNLQPCFPQLVDDFYEEIQRHPEALKVIIGGAAQIKLLKQTFLAWLEELFFGQRDIDYVARRWRVGQRHVEVGLNQIYVNAAMARLRSGLLTYHAQICAGTSDDLQTRTAINKLIDLDLALIEDAYQAEFVAWQNREERQKLLQAERLAAIGQTMTGLVHESRNALQRCRACLEMLAADVGDRPKALDLVRRIQQAQDDVHQLFEEVREYAAPLNLKRSDCELAEIWRQAWHELSHLHQEKQLRLCESIVGRSLRGEVDRFALVQVFRNILENAIQASPHQGEISIDCPPAQLDGKHELQIAIRDQGSGIPLENRPRVLEPFFTTKTKGTGLGLAIAQRIVESHGGRIAVGDPPAGAEILIHLPRFPL